VKPSKTSQEMFCTSKVAYTCNADACMLLTEREMRRCALLSHEQFTARTALAATSLHRLCNSSHRPASAATSRALAPLRPHAAAPSQHD